MFEENDIESEMFILYASVKSLIEIRSEAAMHRIMQYIYFKKNKHLERRDSYMECI